MTQSPANGQGSWLPGLNGLCWDSSWAASGSIYFTRSKVRGRRLGQPQRAKRSSLHPDSKPFQRRMQDAPRAKITLDNCHRCARNSGCIIKDIRGRPRMWPLPPMAQDNRSAPGPVDGQVMHTTAWLSRRSLPLSRSSTSWSAGGRLEPRKDVSNL